MMRLALLPLILLLSLVLGSIAMLVLQLDWADLAQTIADPELHFAVGMSLATAFTSLFLSCLIALPAAWAMVRLRFWGKGVVNVLLDIPMVTPPLIIGIGLLLLLGRSGPVAPFWPQLPELLFSPVGVIIAQTYVASAILIRTAIAAFASIDTGYVQAGHNMGLSPFKTALLIELPLRWQSLSSGCVLAFARALGEFGATLMLAGAIRMHTETLPMAVYLNISSGDFSLAIACALVLLALAGCLLLLLHLLQSRSKPIHVGY